jgi:hypothetical protein
MARSKVKEIELTLPHIQGIKPRFSLAVRVCDESPSYTSFISPHPISTFTKNKRWIKRLDQIRIQSRPCQNRFSVQKGNRPYTQIVIMVVACKRYKVYIWQKVQCWQTVVQFLQREEELHLSEKTINYGDLSIQALLSEKTIKLGLKSYNLVTITQPVWTISIRSIST